MEISEFPDIATNYKEAEMSKLVNLKLAVINYYEGEENAYRREQMAGNECWTSKKDLDWSGNKMSDKKAEMLELRRASGAEVVDVKLEKEFNIYKSMEQENAVITEDHEANLAVFKKITGKDWTPRSSKVSDPKNAQQINKELDKLLGSVTE